MMIDVAVMDSVSFSVPNVSRNCKANLMPNTECTTASINGSRKKIPVCLKSDFEISLSSAPILRSISYLPMLSTFSESSLRASIAPQAIRNTRPIYSHKNVTIAPNPTLASAMSALVFNKYSCSSPLVLLAYSMTVCEYVCIFFSMSALSSLVSPL